MFDEILRLAQVKEGRVKILVTLERFRSHSGITTT